MLPLLVLEITTEEDTHWMDGDGLRRVTMATPLLGMTNLTSVRFHLAILVSMTQGQIPIPFTSIG